MKKETSSEFYLVLMVNILLADAGSGALRMLKVSRDDFEMFFSQRTTANASTRGSRRPKRRVLCVNSASLRKTRSTLTLNLRRRAEHVVRKRGPRGKHSRSARPCSGPPVPTPHRGPLGPTPPSPLLPPSVWSPQYAATPPPWATETTKTTTPHRRTRTQRAMTQMRDTTLMTTLHSSFAGVERDLTTVTTLFSCT